MCQTGEQTSKVGLSVPSVLPGGYARARDCSDLRRDGTVHGGGDVVAASGKDVHQDRALPYCKCRAEEERAYTLIVFSRLLKRALGSCAEHCRLPSAGASRFRLAS